MDMMAIRRRALMASKKKKEPIDTTPKIAEYDKGLPRSNGEPTNMSGFCYTEWIDFVPNLSSATGTGIEDNCSKGEPGYTYQYEVTNTASGATQIAWYYFSRSLNATDRVYTKIRYGFPTSSIDDVYAYCSSTGQILFAGRNTEYYGYANIHDMP